MSLQQRPPAGRRRVNPQHTVYNNSLFTHIFFRLSYREGPTCEYLFLKQKVREALLHLFEPLPPGSDVLLPALQALHAVHLVSFSRRVDVPHRSERGLNPAGHLPQQSLEIGHPLLVDDDPASLVVRVAVPEHENALHHGLREKVWLLRAHRRA